MLVKIINKHFEAMRGIYRLLTKMALRQLSLAAYYQGFP